MILVNMRKMHNILLIRFIFHVLTNFVWKMLQDGRISYKEFELMMKSGSDWRNGSRQYSRQLFNNLTKKLFKDSSLKEN